MSQLGSTESCTELNSVLLSSSASLPAWLYLAFCKHISTCIWHTQYHNLKGLLFLVSELIAYDFQGLTDLLPVEGHLVLPK